MYNKLTKNSKKIISALLASALVVTATPALNVDAAKAAGTISATKKTIKVGKTFKLTLKKVSKKATVSWKSSNTKVAALAKSGKTTKKVTAKKAGAATVTATIKQKGKTTKKLTCKVTVVKKATKLSIAPTKGAKYNYVYIGSTRSLTAKATSAASKDYVTSWKSSNTKVAKVAATKKNKASVSGIKAGTVTITATTFGGKTATIKLTVKKKATPATTAPTGTPVVPTGSPIVSATPVVPTSTAVVPTSTAVVPTSTAVVPTSTAVVPTSTAVVPTSTAVVPTSTAVVPTSTAVVPTSTAVAPTAAAVTVSAVSAAVINTKTIAVVFNRDLTATEQKGILATVTKSNVEQAIVSTFKDAKTLYITRDTDIAFSADSYVVKIAGLEKAFSQTVTVEAAKVASIQITNNELIKNDTKSAYFYYTVKDQYGTDITATTTNIQTTTSYGPKVVLEAGKGTVSAENGTDEIFAATATVPANVVISLADAATGTITTKTLKVSEAATLKTFTLGNIILPTGKTRIYAKNANAAKIAVEAKDTYGNEIKDLGALGDAIQFISSSEKVVFTFITDVTDGKVYINVDTTSVDAATAVNVTTVVKATGAIAKTEFNVVKTAEPTTIEYGNLNTAVLAIGDTAYLDITVKDQFGEVMTAADYSTALADKVTGTGNLANKVSIETTEGKNYGKIKLVPAGVAGTAVISVAAGDKTYTKSVEVKAARVVSAVVAPKTISLIQGATTDLGFTFKDQYGEVMDAKDNAAEHSGYKIAVTKTSGDDNGLTITAPVGATGDDESSLATITAEADAAKTGVYTVKVALTTDSGYTQEKASASVKVTVLSDVATGLTYSVEDIALVPTCADAKTSIYASEIKVKGITADGTEVVLPEGIITGVTVLNNDNDYFSVEDNKVFVNQIKLAEQIPANAKVQVQLNTSTGMKLVESNILKSSKEAPKAVELGLYTADPITGATEAKKLDVGATEVSKITATANTSNAGSDANTFAGAAYLVQKDQYGVYKELTNQDIVINSKTLLNAAGLKFSTGKLVATTITTATAEKDITLSVVVDGKAKTFTLYLTAVVTD